jgi:hypothetical protein
MNELESHLGIPIGASDYVTTFKTYIGVLNTKLYRSEIASHIIEKPLLEYANHTSLFETNKITIPSCKSEINVIVINSYDYKIWQVHFNHIPHCLLSHDKLSSFELKNHKYVFVIQSLFAHFLKMYDVTLCARIIIDNAYSVMLPRANINTFPGFIWLITSDRYADDEAKSPCVKRLLSGISPHVYLRNLCFLNGPNSCEFLLDVTVGNMITYKNTDNICPICYESLTDEILISNCCKNAYHVHCYDNRSRCIVCNTESNSIKKSYTNALFSDIEQAVSFLVKSLDNPTVFMNRSELLKNDRKVIKKYSNVIPSDNPNPVTIVKDNICAKIRYLNV